MENILHSDNTQEDKKAVVKSWLYKWLSTLEIQTIKEAKLTESGDTETIVITFNH